MTTAATRRNLRRSAALVTSTAAVLAVGAIAAPPAHADYFRHPKCVVANSMSVFPNSTSDRAYSTVATFNTTVYAAQEANGRYHVARWSPRGDWQGWISADPRWTRNGVCGQLS